jgi:hypothetical protein
MVGMAAPRTSVLPERGHDDFAHEIGASRKKK